MTAAQANRITALFAELRAAERTALIPYITAGDPAPGWSATFMHALVAGGADLLELGMPFSDPEADGPDIQAACERALRHRTSLQDTLAEVAAFRRKDSSTPVILMGYLNPIERMGYDRFVAAAIDADLDGILIVNMPPEEAGVLQSKMQAKNMSLVYLVAPTTTTERMGKIAAASTGFVYYVSLKGTTGAGRLDIDHVRTQIARLRSVTSMPLAVGFGISDAATAQAVAEVADAVVLGAAVVRRIAKLSASPHLIAPELEVFMSELRSAIDRKR